MDTRLDVGRAGKHRDGYPTPRARRVRVLSSVRNEGGRRNDSAALPRSFLLHQVSLARIEDEEMLQPGIRVTCPRQGAHLLAGAAAAGDAHRLPPAHLDRALWLALPQRQRLVLGEDAQGRNTVLLEDVVQRV